MLVFSLNTIYNITLQYSMISVEACIKFTNVMFTEHVPHRKVFRIVVSVSAEYNYLYSTKFSLIDQRKPSISVSLLVTCYLG